MTQYLKFKALHQQAKPLILGNVWNAQSAKVFEKLNFGAIGTSSAAIAHSLGYEDGEQMSFSELLFVVERIKKSTTLPFTVDIESGYGNNATEIYDNILQLYKLGIVGINIEGSFIENGERKLRDVKEFSEVLKDIGTRLNQQQAELFINVRCDLFLLNIPNSTAQAVHRIKQYEQSGADGIFMPCITNTEDIKTIVSQTKLPLNVMCMPALPDFNVLSSIGVKRISMGNFLNVYTYNAMKKAITHILNQQSFNSLF